MVSRGKCRFLVQPGKEKRPPAAVPADIPSSRVAHISDSEGLTPETQADLKMDPNYRQSNLEVSQPSAESQGNARGRSNLNLSNRGKGQTKDRTDAAAATMGSWKSICV